MRSVASVSQAADAETLPVGRPWSCAADAADVERRFRLDRDGWRRRIRCARRTSHDAADPVAPDGRWTA
jgi:transposase